MLQKESLQFVEITISKWEDLGRFFEASGKCFVFRGQSEAAWPLITSLERAIQRFSEPWSNSIEVSERWMLHEFKTKHHLFASSSPDDKNVFEWLALLQHHGCPTRLLDFTYSLYVAAHFAISDAISDAAVWALNHWAIRDRLHAQFEIPYIRGQALKDEVNRHHIATINACICQSDGYIRTPHLVPLVPTKASQRMSRQQGLFFSPTTFGGPQSRVSFWDCLCNSFGTTQSSVAFQTIDLDEFVHPGFPEGPSARFACVKLIIPKTMQYTALKHLAMMGMTEETLFPDMDGLARSLVTKHIRI